MACGTTAAHACGAAVGLTSASSSPALKAQADALCRSRRFSSLRPSGPRSDSRLGPRPRVSSAVRPSHQSKPWCGLLELDSESLRLVWRRRFEHSKLLLRMTARAQRSTHDILWPSGYYPTKSGETRQASATLVTPVFHRNGRILPLLLQEHKHESGWKRGRALDKRPMSAD